MRCCQALQKASPRHRQEPSGAIIDKPAAFPPPATGGPHAATACPHRLCARCRRCHQSPCPSLLARAEHTAPSGSCHHSALTSTLGAAAAEEGGRRWRNLESPARLGAGIRPARPDQPMVQRSNQACHVAAHRLDARRVSNQRRAAQTGQSPKSAPWPRPSPRLATPFDSSTPAERPQLSRFPAGLAVLQDPGIWSRS